MIRGRGLGEAVAIALAFAVTAVAQEYSFRLYGPAEGLQNLVVLSLAQDHAGYIWAGTEGGLYRYDGTRFRLMGQAEGLPCSTEVHGLFVASDGALWANTCARIFRFDGQRFVAIQGVDRLLRGAQVMADGAGGGVLITTSAGLYEASRGADGSFSTRSYPLPAALAGKPMHGILRQGGRVWFGCDQQLCMEQAGQVSSVRKRNKDCRKTRGTEFKSRRMGPCGCAVRRASTAEQPGQTRFSQEKPDIASSGFWGALTLGRDGSIMVPTDQGLAIHTKAGWSVVNRQRGLRNENTGAVLEDRDGSVWIGLAGGGVARWLGRGVWESWKMDQGLPVGHSLEHQAGQERSPLGRHQLGADAHRRFRADQDLDQKGRAGRRQRPLAGRDLRRFHMGGHEAGRLGPDRSCFRKDSPRRSQGRAALRSGRRVCGSA